mmetsp:Transcript_15830/g.15228  ORF Transcript_15830/g.15228 Transcript_15830/m.15228 type:complete len:132 (-) Transcript_15830:312-707(-)
MFFQNHKKHQIFLLSLLWMSKFVVGHHGYAPYNILMSSECKTVNRNGEEGKKRTRPRPCKRIEQTSNSRRRLNVQSKTEVNQAIQNSSQAALWGTGIFTAFNSDPTSNMIENLLEVSSVVETESLETFGKH